MTRDELRTEVRNILRGEYGGRHVHVATDAILVAAKRCADNEASVTRGRLAVAAEALRNVAAWGCTDVLRAMTCLEQLAASERDEEDLCRTCIASRALRYLTEPDGASGTKGTP